MYTFIFAMIVRRVSLCLFLLHVELRVFIQRESGFAFKEPLRLNSNCTPEKQSNYEVVSQTPKLHHVSSYSGLQ